MERIKAETAEAANRELENKQKKFELLMEQKEKSYQEHVKQLTEKMQKEREQLIAEHNKIISHKLQVLGHIISVSSCAPVKNKCIRKKRKKEKKKCIRGLKTQLLVESIYCSQHPTQWLTTVCNSSPSSGLCRYCTQVVTCTYFASKTLIHLK